MPAQASSYIHTFDIVALSCREDPESLEIFHSELKCLEPGECLTSTIMNFYIRFVMICLE